MKKLFAVLLIACVLAVGCKGKESTDMPELDSPGGETTAAGGEETAAGDTAPAENEPGETAFEGLDIESMDLSGNVAITGPNGFGLIPVTSFEGDGFSYGEASLDAPVQAVEYADGAQFGWVYYNLETDTHTLAPATMEDVQSGSIVYLWGSGEGDDFIATRVMILQQV